MTCTSCKRKSGDSGEWWEVWYYVFGEAVCGHCFQALLPPGLLGLRYYLAPGIMTLVPGGIDRWAAATDHIWGERRGVKGVNGDADQGGRKVREHRGALQILRPRCSRGCD